MSSSVSTEQSHHSTTTEETTTSTSTVNQVELTTRLELPVGQERYHGIVKTFRKTYGFAVVVGESQYAGKDIMVNHANIMTTKECYKTLKRGEHIEFGIEEVEGDRIQAINVTGPHGHVLQCETNPRLVQRRFNVQGRGHARGRGYSSGRGRGHARGHAQARGQYSGQPRRNFHNTRRVAQSDMDETPSDVVEN